MLVLDDEVEDGAYVVLDEEEEDAENQGAAIQQAQPDRSVNGSAAQLSNADDDRYVAEAYSAGEERFDRSVNARKSVAQHVLFVSCLCWWVCVDTVQTMWLSTHMPGLDHCQEAC